MISSQQSAQTADHTSTVGGCPLARAYPTNFAGRWVRGLWPQAHGRIDVVPPVQKGVGLWDSNSSWSFLPFHLVPSLANPSPPCAARLRSTVCSPGCAIQWGCSQHLPEGVWTVAAGWRRAEGPIPSTRVAGCWGRIAPFVAPPVRAPSSAVIPQTADDGAAAVVLRRHDGPSVGRLRSRPACCSSPAH